MGLMQVLHAPRHSQVKLRALKQAAVSGRMALHREGGKRNLHPSNILKILPCLSRIAYFFQKKSDIHEGDELQGLVAIIFLGLRRRGRGKT